jgi:hypothetical protein
MIVMHAPTSSRRSRYLGAGLITAIIACMIIGLAWSGVKAAAVADRQRSKLRELEQARALWEARPFSSYRLIIQLQPRGGSVCEKEFEVDEPAQTKTLRDTCPGPDYSYGNALMELLGSPRTVPGLFDYIEAEIGRVGECGTDGCACDGGRTIDAAYDTDLGYPKRIEGGGSYYKDWTTKGWCMGHTLAAPLGGPVTVTVNPIE